MTYSLWRSVKQLMVIVTGVVLINCGGGSSTPEGDSSVSDLPENNNSDSTKDDGSTAAWRLPAGHYVTAKMPPRIIFPRPDTEITNASARQKRASTQFEYRIPIIVQGGAYPFKYELVGVEGVDYPSGMTIGETLVASADGTLVPPDNYGEIRWQPSGTGIQADGQNFSFTVRVTDQDGSIATSDGSNIGGNNGGVNQDVTITGTIDNAAFVFVDKDGGGSLTDLDQIYLNDQTDSTYAGKIIVLREASTMYNNAGDPNARGEALLNTNKPLSYIGYPDERPIINLNSASFVVNGVSDTFFYNLVFDGVYDRDVETESSKNSYFGFRVVGVGHRATWSKVRFQNAIAALPSLGYNNGCITTSDAGAYRNYIAITNSEFENLDSSANGISAIALNVSRYFVFARNLISNARSRSIIYNKSGNADLSFRANTLINSNNNYSFGFLLNNTNRGPGTFTSQRVESAYNLGIASNDTMQLYRINQGVSASADATDMWTYRNTMIGEYHWRANGIGPNYMENEVIINDKGGVTLQPNEAIVINETGTFTDTRASGAVDLLTGKLAGTARTNHLGQKGFEIQ